MQDEGISIKLPNCQIKNNICMAIDKIHNIFPNIKINEYVVEIKEDKKLDSIAQIDKGIISIRGGINQASVKEYLNDRNDFKYYKYNEDFPKDLITNLEYRVSPKNTDNPTGLLLHEIGHSLSKGNNSFYDNFIKYLDKNIPCFNNYKIKVLPKELSVQSVYYKNELFADAFADYIMNGKEASHAGKLVPKFLKEQGII